MQLSELEKYLHQQIPLSAAMGIHVAEWNSTQLILRAPLSANRNHLGTAFGGSLNAIATLAGYSAVWLALDDSNAHVVIRESTISFRRPVVGDICAVCLLPDQSELDRFGADFSRKGKSRISLDVFIDHEGERAVNFSGTFVAVR